MNRSRSRLYPDNDPNFAFSTLSEKIPINLEDSEQNAESKRRFYVLLDDNLESWAKKSNSGEPPLSPRGIAPSALSITNEEFEEHRENYQKDISLLKQRYLGAVAQIDTLHTIIAESQKQLKAANVEIDNLRSNNESDHRIMQAAGIVASPLGSRDSDSPAVTSKTYPKTPGGPPADGSKPRSDSTGEFPFRDYSSLRPESPEGSPHRLSRSDPPRPPTYDPLFRPANASAPPTPTSRRIAPASIQPSATQFLYDDAWAQSAELYTEVLLQSAKVSFWMSDWPGFADKVDLAGIEAEQLNFEPLKTRIAYYRGLVAVGQVKWKEAAEAFREAGGCRGFYKEGEFVEAALARAEAAIEALKKGKAPENKEGERTASEEAHSEALRVRGVSLNEEAARHVKEMEELIEMREALQASADAICARRGSENSEGSTRASDAELKAIDNALDASWPRVLRMVDESDQTSKKIEELQAKVVVNKAAVRERQESEQALRMSRESEQALRAGLENQQAFRERRDNQQAFRERRESGQSAQSQRTSGIVSKGALDCARRLSEEVQRESTASQAFIPSRQGHEDGFHSREGGGRFVRSRHASEDAPRTTQTSEGGRPPISGIVQSMRSRHTSEASIHSQQESRRSSLRSSTQASEDGARSSQGSRRSSLRSSTQASEDGARSSQGSRRSSLRSSRQGSVTSLSTRLADISEITSPVEAIVPPRQEGEESSRWRSGSEHIANTIERAFPPPQPSGQRSGSVLGSDPPMTALREDIYPRDSPTPRPAKAISATYQGEVVVPPIPEKRESFGSSNLLANTSEGPLPLRPRQPTAESGSHAPVTAPREDTYPRESATTRLVKVIPATFPGEVVALPRPETRELFGSRLGSNTLANTTDGSLPFRPRQPNAESRSDPTVTAPREFPYPRVPAALRPAPILHGGELVIPPRPEDIEFYHARTGSTFLPNPAAGSLPFRPRQLSAESSNPIPRSNFANRFYAAAHAASRESRNASASILGNDFAANTSESTPRRRHKSWDSSGSRAWSDLAANTSEATSHPRYESEQSPGWRARGFTDTARSTQQNMDPSASISRIAAAADTSRAAPRPRYEYLSRDPSASMLRNDLAANTTSHPRQLSGHSPDWRPRAYTESFPPRQRNRHSSTSTFQSNLAADTNETAPPRPRYEYPSTGPSSLLFRKNVAANINEAAFRPRHESWDPSYLGPQGDFTASTTDTPLPVPPTQRRADSPGWRAKASAETSHPPQQTRNPSSSISQIAPVANMSRTPPLLVSNIENGPPTRARSRSEALAEVTRRLIRTRESWGPRPEEGRDPRMR